MLSEDRTLNIAMMSIHSSPTGELSTKDTGGMSVYVRELAGALGDRGHSIDIYTHLNNHNKKLVEILHRNVRLIRLDVASHMHLSKSQGGRGEACEAYL